MYKPPCPCLVAEVKSPSSLLREHVIQATHKDEIASGGGAKNKLGLAIRELLFFLRCMAKNERKIMWREMLVRVLKEINNRSSNDTEGN